MSPAAYLWIALGGALGSVGRAWLALAVARLTGAQFPWGTILINVVGSFVIGFFGTLTAVSEGRFALSAEARAFVMVGLCGGFTTFSSFSLQTLELARDGRPGQALANIALSLVLCLGSVAAGHYGAMSLNQGRMGHEAAQLDPAADTPPHGESR
jgi:protein CrcB